MMFPAKLRLGHRVSFTPANACAPGCSPSPRKYFVATVGNGIASHRLQPWPRVRSAPTEIVSGVLLEEPETRTIPHESSAAGDDEGVGHTAGPGPLSSSPLTPQVSFISLVGGKYTVRGRLLLPAPAARVYAMLTNYESCHQVFANIAASEVLRPEAGGLQVVQSCRWNFLAFSGTFRVHLGVLENPEEGTLLFNLVQSNFMRDFEGRWAVRPAEAPRSAVPIAAPADTGEWCEVEHQLSVVPSVPVPPPVSYYTRRIFVRQVEGILADLQKAVLAGAKAEAGAGPDGARGLAVAGVADDA